MVTLLEYGQVMTSNIHGVSPDLGSTSEDEAA